VNVRVLNFHGIGSPERQLDPGEAPFWLSREAFCDVLDRVVDHPDRSRLVITFDDSNSSDMAIALPELLVRGLSASFFILTGRLGRPGSLDRADVAELHASGMRIGSHGTNHSDFTALPPGRLAEELVRSKQLLEDVCAAPVQSLAIPFGRYNASALRAIRKAGYRIAYTSDGGSARPGNYLQPRRSLRHDIPPPEIDSILAGRMPPLKRIRRSLAMGLKRLR
jgi:peptidoglycan/xylan/chitin deacetylase (PgdA/CDA1 family)